MIKINKEKCDGCGTCVAVCPQGAVVMPKIAVINDDLCVNCKICVNICPVGALE
jgi:ferredoxin